MVIERRTSLVQELEGKDPLFVSEKINEAIHLLSPIERTEILNDFTQKEPAVEIKEKPFFLARLLDALFDRKTNPFLAPPQRTQDTSQTPSALPKPKEQVKGTISVPTQIQDKMVNERQVGDYIFIKTLGKGTFGKVKLAQHVVTKEHVAIKIIEKVNIKTNKQKIAVDREVRLMKLLHHPHIVKVYEVYESKDFIWIIMENASGGELFDHIVKNGMIQEPEARRFFRQILSAVEYCHLNSVIHRDLKPENLLLDHQLNIKIIDFGFGNTFHRDRLLDTYCGSPFYAAPEMIQGIRYIGPEVDVWSMGVILFALLSGRLPFDAGTMNELYEKIAKGKYVCPSHFTPETVHLISRMLTVDPKKRATLAEVKNHVWVNKDNKTPIESYLPHRSVPLVHLHPESVQELVSYGFKEHDLNRILRLEMGLHPVVSLYHLIEEARQRKEESLVQKCISDYLNDAKKSQTNDRANSLATIDSAESASKISFGIMDHIARKLEQSNKGEPAGPVTRLRSQRKFPWSK